MTTAIPTRAGVGFKLEHARDILQSAPDLGWFEVHPENYMVKGGPRHALLRELRARYPLSIHGVALSLGGAEPLDADHLVALLALIERYEPGLVSEHVAWSAHGDLYFGDLLPTPLTWASLDNLCRNIEIAQTALGRRILIENPTNYLRLANEELGELHFLSETVRRTGCGLLIDVNNILVSATNLGFDATAYVDAVPGELVGEIHLGGHEVDAGEGPGLLIDSHARPVADSVWILFERLVARIGPRPTLVEWDNAVPDWPVLLAEAQRAEAVLDRHRQLPSAA